MRTFCFLTFIALAKATTLEGPYGLLFSPSSISASRINSSGFLEITKHPAGREYLDYYNDFVHNIKLSNSDPRGLQQLLDPEQAAEIFRKDIKKVTNTLLSSSGHAPEYATVFIPSIFNSDVHQAALQALVADGENANDLFNFGPFHKACSHAFDFLDGKQIGRTVEERNDDSILTIILVLEYEKEYLHIGTTEIVWERESFAHDRAEICLECGEQYRKELGDEKYTQRVQQFLEAFIEKNFKGPHRPYRDEIRSIVLAGDASQVAFSRLGAIALSAVGTDVVTIAKGVGPSEVGIRGAAKFARWIQKYKGSEIIEYCTTIQDEEYYEQNRLMEQYRLMKKKKLAEQNKLMVIGNPHENYHEEL